ncbi:MAG: sigma-70 family RNA polymerase sigma factor [Myxococcales bacterium]|nr:sigma-70 family RNA polymerase sigma factor [Myxococcales bacterium]
MRSQSKLNLGEAEAREVLRRYEPDVEKLAQRLRPAVARARALDLDDLRAEGRIAVLEAISSYGGYGVPERTWVRTRVRQRMIDTIRRFDIRTRDEIRLAMKYAHGETENEQEHEAGRAAASRQMMSLDWTGSDGRSLMSRLSNDRDCTNETGPEHDAHVQRQRQRLMDAISELSPRQQRVLKFRLFYGLSLREVGDHLAITESRACQLQKRAVERLSQAMRAS